jgi:protein involved in sex pheromone biosynthesis
MKKVIVFLSLILLSSCATDSTGDDPTIIERLDNNEYSMILPFVASEVRQYHGTYLGRADFLEIGSRLEDKSKEHFNVEDYYLSEGQVLTNTELSRLVRRESTENPYGLNPPSGSEFLVGTSNISVLDAVVVADVVEIDFYQQSGGEIKLAGMSFAIVLNQSLSSPDGLINVSDQVLYDYGSNMGRKLDRYIRSLSDMEDMPIYIALYVTNPSDAVLPGRYIADGYFTARGGQFSPNNEQWVLFPSTQASSMDAGLADKFNALKTRITEFIPESVGVVGEARYVDNQTNFLRLTLTIQAKTYSEIRGLTQFTIELLKDIDQRDFPIVVRINSISETLVLIQLFENDELNVIYTY